MTWSFWERSSSPSAARRGATRWLASLLVVGLTACGESDDPTGDDSSPVAARDAGSESTPRKGDASAETCTDGKTSTCSCSTGRTGVHTCRNGKYSACMCSSETGKDPGGKTPVNKCKAGYYTGSFKGKYKPGALGFGLFASGYEVDIEGGKSFFDDSLPPLAFTLVEETTQRGEFSTYSVRGGCMQGLATAVAITQSPVVAKLTGDVDCATGQFTGTLEGYYTFIGIPGADYSFTGPVTGELLPGDVPAGEGTWTVSEPPAADGNAAGGGEGSWDAKWTSETAPMLTTVDPCASIGPGGTHAPIVDDAGMPLSPTDAGMP